MFFFLFLFFVFCFLFYFNLFYWFVIGCFWIVCFVFGGCFWFCKMLKFCFFFYLSCFALSLWFPSYLTKIYLPCIAIILKFSFIESYFIHFVITLSAGVFSILLLVIGWVFKQFTCIFFQFFFYFSRNNGNVLKLYTDFFYGCWQAIFLAL